MINAEYTVKLDNGKEMIKKFVAGNIVRVNDEENKPLSFDLVINKGKDKEPEYINRIAVDREARFANLVKSFKPGQQVFCEINVVISEKKDSNGNPYRNLWLQSFEYGRSPKN
jgi:hypothetical protein